MTLFYLLEVHCCPYQLEVHLNVVLFNDSAFLLFMINAMTLILIL